MSMRPLIAALVPLLLLAGCQSGVTCKQGLCVEILSSEFTVEPCGEGESCTYTNVFFVVTQDEVNVANLQFDDVSLQVGDREVGSEGLVGLGQETSLRVRLLLDRSYSITASSATETVRDAAEQFVRSLPAVAQVAVATFASEDAPPTYLDVGGEAAGEVFHDRNTAADLIAQRYDTPQEQTSSTFTKLHDAVVAWAQVPLTDDAVFQPVLTVFTDGRDTDSDIEDSGAARNELDRVAPELRVYAIGLGDEIQPDDLDVLSEGRFYRAESQAELQAAFSDVADDLAAIYLLRALVPDTDDPDAELRVRQGDVEVVAQFEVGEVGSFGGTETGGCGAGSGGEAGGCSVSDQVETCNDSCPSAGNGVCEDGGEDAEDYACEYGTDCSDCGERGDGFGCSVTPDPHRTLLGCVGLGLLLAASRRRGSRAPAR